MVKCNLYNDFIDEVEKRVVLKNSHLLKQQGLDFLIVQVTFYKSGSIILNVLIKEEKESSTFNLVSREAITNETVSEWERFPYHKKHLIVLRI